MQLSGEDWHGSAIGLQNQLDQDGSLLYISVSALDGSTENKNKPQDDSFCSLALQEDILVLQTPSQVAVSHQHGTNISQVNQEVSTSTDPFSCQ